MRVQLSVIGLCLAALSAAAAPPQAIVHSDHDDATTAMFREVSRGSVGPIAVEAGADAALRDIFAVRSPDRSTLAIGLLDAAGNLSLRLLTDAGLGSATLIGQSVPSTRPAPIGAAYTARTGRLVMAYASADSAECFVRSHDGSLGNVVAAPLGLSSTPVRIKVVQSPTSDDVLIVAHDSSQRLAAAIWNGAEFRGADLADGGFDGGMNRWDAAWTRGTGPIVAWARAGESSLRVRKFNGEGWEAMDATPTGPGAITRISLATDASQAQTGVAAGIVFGASRLEIALHDGAAWTIGTLMTTTLDHAKDVPVALAFEGTDGGLMCAWLESGSQRIHTRRQSGGAWSAPQTTNIIGAGLTELGLSPGDEASQAVIVARREVGGQGSVVGTDLSDYAIYANNGNIKRGDRLTINGLYGSKVPGLSIPDAPGGNAGGTNITLNHDQTRSLDPGAYRDLSFGDRTRINFSSGTYIFRRLSNSGHDSRFVCDTSEGDVSIVFTTGAVNFRDRFRIERQGNGVVSIHVKSGAFKVGHDCNIEAVLVAHSGAMQLSDRQRITGHLFGHSNIQIGHDSVVSIPRWSLPVHLGGSEPASQRLYALVTSSGAIGPVTELTSDGIEGKARTPIAAAVPSPAGSLRLVRWREVSPDQ